MPEGPEIEANRRLVARLVGRRITRATALEQGGGPRDGLFDASVMDDPDADAASVEAALLKASYIRAACRRGKQLWVELAAKKGGPASCSLLVHCGMTGALVLQDTAATPYKNFTVDETQWPPKFTKLELEFDQGPPLAFCDPRRFGRLRLRGADPLAEPPLNALAADFLAPPSVETFAAILGRTKAPVKAILLDQQKLVAGVGNWVVDEVLFHAGVLPSAPCDTLSAAQVGALRASLVDVGATAVQANADSEKFPAGWLFHHRWRNQTSGTFSSPIGVIKFDTVGGRTTAWLPSAQKAGDAGKKAAAAAKRGAPDKKTKPAKRAKKADAAPTPARRSGRGK